MSGFLVFYKFHLTVCWGSHMTISRGHCPDTEHINEAAYNQRKEWCHFIVMMRLNETQPRRKVLLASGSSSWLQEYEGFNLFQLSALENTDYITVDLQCIPGPLKHLKNMRAVVVVKQSGSVHFCLEIVKRTDRIHRNIQHVPQSCFSAD